MTITPATVTPAAMPEPRQSTILRPEGRPRRAGALTASATFGWRAMLKIKHDPKQLVESAAIPVLFTVLFTYLFGGAVSGSPGSYLRFLLPGTLTMTIAIVTMYGGARLAQDTTTGAFDRFRSLPVWRGAPVLGGLLSDAGRYVFASAIVVLLGLVMGYRPGGGAPGVLAAVAVVVAFALSLSWLWAAVALLVRDSAVFLAIANVVLMPLSFASNVFVEPRTMPGWLRAFVTINPISHVADAARDLMNNTGGTGGPVTWTLIATAATTLVFAPLTLHLYGRNR